MVLSIRRAIIAVVFSLFGLPIASPRALADSAPLSGMLTFHNDIASTGVNSHETILTPANVKQGSFIKLYATPVDGQVYAQPLVALHIPITNGPKTKPNATGMHDVAFVATQNNSLYAIDAGPSGGATVYRAA